MLNNVFQPIPVEQRVSDFSDNYMVAQKWEVKMVSGISYAVNPQRQRWCPVVFGSKINWAWEMILGLLPVSGSRSRSQYGIVLRARVPNITEPVVTFESLRTGSFPSIQDNKMATTQMGPIITLWEAQENGSKSTSSYGSSCFYIYALCRHPRRV